MTWDDDVCKVCQTEDTVLPHGNKQSKVLIIGEFPGDDEVIKGIPFIGPTGRILKQELAYLGVDLKQIRRGNLWIHKPNSNLECRNYGAEVMIQEAKGRQVIWLIGSDAVKFFTNEKVSEVNGLQVQSELLSAPTIMACIQPASVFSKPIGEFRFGLKKFVDKLEELKIV